MSRRVASLALLAAVALPLAIGCQFLVFKICIKNQTDYYLDEVAVKESGEPTYPPAILTDIAPGSTGDSGGYRAGSYDIRASFDVADDEVCEPIVEVTEIEIEGTHVCVTYEQQSLLTKGECNDEIYATIEYVL